MTPARRRDVYVVPMRLPNVLHSGIHRIATVYNVVLELEDDAGSATGYCFAFDEREAIALKLLVEQLLDLVGDRDWTEVGTIHTELWHSINHIGQAGPPVMALAAIDTAMWDLLAQHAGLPLYRLWGGGDGVVPAYASGGWLSYPIEELVDEALDFAAQGFTAYKMKVGGRDPHTDIARVAAVQEAVGPNVRVMVDANQAYARADAMRVGRLLQERGVHWYEEPVHAADFAGSAELAQALDMRIATGETIFGVQGFRDLIAVNGADVLMPDLMRCGGPTGVRDVMVLAQAAWLEVSPHLFPEVCAHVVASSGARHRLVEYLPRWWRGFFSEAPLLEKGSVVLGQQPGIGIRVNPDLPRL